MKRELKFAFSLVLIFVFFAGGTQKKTEVSSTLDVIAGEWTVMRKNLYWKWDWYEDYWVIGAAEGNVTIWDVDKSLHCIGELTGLEFSGKWMSDTSEQITTLRFSPDGRSFEGETLFRLYDGTEGRELLKGQREPAPAGVDAPDAPDSMAPATVRLRQLSDGSYIVDWDLGDDVRIPAARVTPASDTVEVEDLGGSIRLNVPEPTEHKPGTITVVENPMMRVTIRHGTMTFTPDLLFEAPEPGLEGIPIPHKWDPELLRRLKPDLSMGIDFYCKVAAGVISKAPGYGWVGWAAEMAEAGGTIAGNYYDDAMPFIEGIRDALLDRFKGPTIRVHPDVEPPNWMPKDVVVPMIRLRSDVGLRSTEAGTAVVYVLEGEAELSGGPDRPLVAIPAGLYSVCSQGSNPVEPMPFDVSAWSESDPSVIDRSSATESWARAWTVLTTATVFSENGAAGFFQEPVTNGNAVPHPGRNGILYLHPVSEAEPARLVRRVSLPATSPRLALGVSANSSPEGDWRLVVKVDGEEVASRIIGGGGWQDLSFDLSAYTSQTVDLAVEAHATGWWWEYAFIDYIELISEQD